MHGAPTAIDLFCGAGGLTEGLKHAGFTVLAAIDSESLAIETYRANHSDVNAIIEQDIRAVNADSLRKTLGLLQGDLDLIAGCPPCQGFSKLRTRNKAIAADDERNDLIFEYLRFVECFQPKAVMLENVPALAKDQRLKVLLSRLHELGYYIGNQPIRVEDASNYGVPQRRLRMILLASKAGPVPPAEKSTSKITVRKALENAALPPSGTSGDTLHDIKSIRTPRVMDLIRAIPKNGGSRSNIPKELWLPCHTRYPNGFLDVYGRMRWDDVASTITGGCHNPSKGRFLHPDEDRAITLREAAIFQSFRPDYIFSMRKGKDGAALLIGNALPPEFIRRHALSILKVIKPNSSEYKNE